jgi:hypothetical protein
MRLERLMRPPSRTTTVGRMQHLYLQPYTQGLVNHQSQTREETRGRV